MKKVAALFLFAFSIAVSAQTFPVNNLQVNGTATLSKSLVPTDYSRQIATTAFVRDSQACTSAASMGFVSDGTTDNLPAWANWMSFVGNKSACLAFGAGLYKFSGTLNDTLAAGQTLRLQGAGQDATELWFPTTDGLNFTINTSTSVGFINSSSVTIDRLAVTTSMPGSVTGISIRGSTTNGYIPRQTNIEQVALRGHTTSGWWANDIALTDLSDVFIDKVGIYGLNDTNQYGTGIRYVGTADAATPTIINITNSTIFFKQTGILAGGYWQGMNISQTNIVDTTVGVSCSASSQQPQCNIANSQINAARHAVVYDNIITSVISNNLLYQGAYVGLVNGDGMLQFTNNSTNNIVSSNVFSAFSLGGARPTCIDLSASSQANQIINSNYFAGCTTAVVFGSGAPSSTSMVGNIMQSTVPNATTGNVSGLTRLDQYVFNFPGSINIGGRITTSGTGAMVLYGAGGTSASAPHLISGGAGLTSGSTTVNFSGPAVFSSATSFACTANSSSGSANAVGVKNLSGSSIQLIGSGSDTVNYICAGN